MSGDAGAGHLLAGRDDSAGSTLALQGRASSLETRNGALNGMLAQVLEKRRAKESESLRAREEAHAAALERKEALHREELDMKDTAHRNTLVHVETELDALRGRLQAEMMLREKVDVEARDLRSQLEAERTLRLAAEKEQEALHTLLLCELQDDE